MKTAILLFTLCTMAITTGFGQQSADTIPRDRMVGGGGAGIPKVRIPAGTFLMGSSDGSNISDGSGTGLNTTPAEPGREYDETQHEVTLTKAFYMSKYEITNAQYAGFLNAEGVGADGRADVAGFGNRRLVYSDSLGVTYADCTWEAQAGYGNHPVVCVTWYGAKAYADWAGGALPTEAQWEYACRGGQTESLPFGIGDGTELWADMVNFYGPNPYRLSSGGEISNYDGSDGHPNTFPGAPAAVGSYPFANGYGLYDMHGNVMEWCADLFETYPADAVTDPAGPASGSDRVLRGGSWSDVAGYCRSAFRYLVNPDYDAGDVGFRVVFPFP